MIAIHLKAAILKNVIVTRQPVTKKFAGRRSDFYIWQVPGVDKITRRKEE